MQFPDAPGCFSAADTLADVLPNAAEALSLYFEDAPVPDPSALSSVRARAADDLRAGAFLIAVPLIESTSRVVRANISLDKGTLDAIDAAAAPRAASPARPSWPRPPAARSRAGTELGRPAAATTRRPRPLRRTWHQLVYAPTSPPMKTASNYVSLYLGLSGGGQDAVGRRNYTSAGVSRNGSQ